MISAFVRILKPNSVVLALLASLWCITVSGKLRCKKPECDAVDDFLGHPIFSVDALVDTERKILMDWTPKAGCTAHVVMFMQHLGAREGEDYSGWPHEYRVHTFNHQCGTATACMYHDPTWFRFKVVRNPFSRLVSAFIYVMKTTSNYEPTMSFSGLIQQILQHTELERADLFYRHLGYQHRPFERTAFLNARNESRQLGRSLARSSFSPSPYETTHSINPPVYHEIVHIENPRASWARIAQRVSVSLHTMLPRKLEHYAVRSATHSHFVGETPWSELRDAVPQNYGCFFNQSLALQVAQIFAWDIALYRYYYPFAPCDGRSVSVSAVRNEVASVISAA